MPFHFNGYTNMHDLNLDWVTSKIKNIEDAEADTAESAAAAAESATNAAGSAEAAQNSAEAAQQSAEASQQSAEASQQSAENAAETVSDTLNQINVLQARVDNIIPEGTQTEGNTELLDIRVGANGVTYPSAGDAVRGQITELDDKLTKDINGQRELSGNLFLMDTYKYTNNGVTVKNNYDGTLTGDGTATASVYLNFYEYHAETEETVTFKSVNLGGTAPDNNVRIYGFDSGGTGIFNHGWGSWTKHLNAGDYVRFRIAQNGNVLSNFKFAIYISKGSSAIELPYLINRDPFAVVFNEEQTLTEEQKQTARNNIGVEDVLTIYNTYATRYADEEDALVKKVIQDRDANTLTVTLIADTHYRYNGSEVYRNTDIHGMIANLISKKTNSDIIVHLGDVIQGYNTKEQNMNSLAKYWDKQSYGSLPVLYCIGHHEMYGLERESSYLNDPSANTPAECLSAGSFVNRWKNVIFSTDRSNWYYDYKNIRIIGLNSVQVANTRGFRSYDISFLHNALQDTDKKVIVLTHVPLTYQSTITNSAQVIAELNNYIDNQHEVLAYIHGHVHLDNIIPASDVIKFPQVSVCCSLPVQVEIPTDPIYANATAPAREIGTYTEYCFDVVNIHTDTGAIKFYRFGAGSDRTI